jgi:hypothetical protein
VGRPAGEPRSSTTVVSPPSLPASSAMTAGPIRVDRPEAE